MVDSPQLGGGVGKNTRRVKRGSRPPNLGLPPRPRSVEVRSPDVRLVGVDERDGWAVAAEIRRLQGVLDGLVRVTLARGASWRVVGEMVGMDRSNAAKKYRAVRTGTTPVSRAAARPPTAGGCRADAIEVSGS